MQQVELVPKLRQIHELKNKSALFITQVAKDSPAERGGLLDGDILFMFSDQVIETSDELFKMLTEDKVADRQSVKVIRNNKVVGLNVYPVER